MNGPTGAVEDVVSGIEASIRRHVTYSLGRAWGEVSPGELFTAVALSVRDRLVEGALETDQRLLVRNPKRMHYLSIEFLIGRSLGANLDALGLRDAYREAARRLGAELDIIERSEEDAALGNGGLGRLAACFMESLATLGMPGAGYGIHYEFGLFKQEIDNGWQQEKPDNWLAGGSPWEIARPDVACLVPIYGRIEHEVDRGGGYNPMWMDWKVLIGVPHDVFVPGFGARTVNRLRLYQDECASCVLKGWGGCPVAIPTSAMGPQSSEGPARLSISRGVWTNARRWVRRRRFFPSTKSSRTMGRTNISHKIDKIVSACLILGSVDRLRISTGVPRAMRTAVSARRNEANRLAS